jgi:coproporphyrinogen III oxidase-like Fe-S oxidoreductase
VFHGPHWYQEINKIFQDCDGQFLGIYQNSEVGKKNNMTIPTNKELKIYIELKNFVMLCMFCTCHIYFLKQDRVKVSFILFFMFVSLLC